MKAAFREESGYLENTSQDAATHDAYAQRLHPRYWYGGAVISWPAPTAAAGVPDRRENRTDQGAETAQRAKEVHREGRRMFGAEHRPRDETDDELDQEGTQEAQYCSGWDHCDDQRWMPVAGGWRARLQIACGHVSSSPCVGCVWQITAISRDHGRLPCDLVGFQGSAAPSPHDQDRPW
jgi:hypothetical protein